MALPKFIQSSRRSLTPSGAVGTPLAAAAAGGGAPPQSLGFAIEKQEQTLWCWAAVSVSVARFFDKKTTWKQCLVAAKETGGTCCANGSSTVCNKAYFLELALQRTDTFRDIAPRAFDFDEVVTEIAGRTPLGCRVRWDALTAHFVVIDGIAEVDGKQQVDIKDPLYGSATYLYDEFANRYRGIGTWTHSYQTQAPSTAAGGPSPSAVTAPASRRRRVRAVRN